ncbi:MAG TPA: hypothetical protein VI758_06790 [Bacteroidota bacterium]
MTTRLWRTIVSAAIVAILLSACDSGKGQEGERPRLSMFVGVDISGSFVKSGYYDDAMDFLARYLYAHLKGLGDLEVPNALFVGSIGGATANQPKTFYPIETFENKTVEEIGQKLREIFPKSESNPITDFNAFFEQVATTVRNRKLILRPITVVMISDGVPDVPNAGGEDFKSIKLQPLETLSRNITVRLLYTNAEIGKDWQTKVKRTRVKVWTQDAPVMVSWKDPKIFQADKPVEDQARFFRWLQDNVDYGVSARRVD